MHVLADGPYVGREDFALQHFPRRVVRWTSKPVAFADGQFGQLTVYRDVTEEVDLAEERAQRLSQEAFRRK